MKERGTGAKGEKETQTRETRCSHLAELKVASLTYPVWGPQAGTEAGDALGQRRLVSDMGALEAGGTGAARVSLSRVSMGRSLGVVGD